MSLFVLGTQPAWIVCLALALHAGVGVGLGIGYFRSLWWNARFFTAGGGMAAAIAAAIGRFAALGGLLALVSLEGALPLLATALGVMIGRFVVMADFRGAVR